jgi:glycosyltransferase involved in cell wall biosynthesis
VRIALITAAGRPTGAAVHALSLAEALVAAGEEVTVVSSEPPFRRLDPRVRLAGDAGGADLVHAHVPVPADVRTLHDLEPSPAARFVCGSAGVAHAWGRPADVIAPGVRAGRFAVAAGAGAAHERARWRSRIGSGSLILSTAPTPELVEAVARLGRGHRLVATGSDAALEARAAELDVALHQLGAVSYDEYPELVACADAFVLAPTVEGPAVAALEALAAAVPLVLRDLPGFRKRFAGAARFGSTPTGLARALQAALGDESHAQRVAGRGLAARRTWGAAAREHQALYRELVALPAAA